MLSVNDLNHKIRNIIPLTKKDLQDISKYSIADLLSLIKAYNETLDFYRETIINT
jgi:hypothetical protein